MYHLGGSHLARYNRKQLFIGSRYRCRLEASPMARELLEHPPLNSCYPHSHVFNVFHVEAKRRQNRHREWNILFIQLSIVNMKSLFSFYSCTNFRSSRIEDRIDGYRFCSRQIEKHDNIARYVRLEQFSIKAGNVRYLHGSAKST